MRKIILIISSLVIFSWQYALGQRFLDSIFETVDSVTDIQYGEAPDYLHQTEKLYADFYEPHQDTMHTRPLFIFAHGGGFVEGSRKGPSHIPMLCERLAKRGYATASISYRLDPRFKIFKSDSDRKVMTDAMHDMRAAIRFFKANWQKYRVDTNNIFISGESAGAVTAMMAGYVDKQKELKAYPRTDPDNIEGNSGTPGHTSNVKAVLCLCGLIIDTLAMESSHDDPLLWIHGSSDPMVPFSLAEEIPDRAAHIGLQYQKIVFDGATHCPWYHGLPRWQFYLDSMVNYVSHFMYPLITGKKAPALAKAPPPLKVANILQSNMVIQQDKPFRIWGTAANGDTILLLADWMKKSISVYADGKGNWLGSIKVPKAVRGNFDPHVITVIRRGDTINMKNILIGDVWICSGQSNMTYTMDTSTGREGGVIDYEKEIAAADYPAIRLFTVAWAWEKKPQPDCRGEWKICSSESVRRFSAVGYYFGRKLFQQLNIPIGLVDNGMPGAGCQAFTQREIMEADPVLKQKYIDPYDAKPEKGENILAILQRPALIYNGMIYPVRHLSARGFIWYQGESNRSDGMLYARLCTAMLKGWRRDFNQGNLPFYFVQLPAYSWGKHDSTAYEYALLREAQASMLSIKNTGMAVTMDVGEPDNIHPHNKKPVGIRLAKVALHDTYGYRDIVDKGPVYKKFMVDGNTAKISFDKPGIGGGLTTSDGQPPKYFYVAGADKIFHEARAQINGNEVWISSPEVLHPVAVRYAFTNYPLTNFENKEGLPAWPFRTDKWNP